MSQFSFTETLACTEYVETEGKFPTRDLPVKQQVSLSCHYF